jgi:hypothetical protein
MKITLIIEQTFDVDADTLVEAFAWLREDNFPTSEKLLAVKNELGEDITGQWRKCEEPARTAIPLSDAEE